MEIDWVPIVLFVCLTYAFTFAVKTIVEARMRSLLAKDAVSEDLLRSILTGEQQQRRLSSLRWGLALVAVSVGFGLIQSYGWTEITPGVVAVLAGSVGIGQLAFFALSTKFTRNG
ncbi:MAG: hypothetical protein J0I77_09690 [Rudaea sp.]|uniref:hypothetical protein n=1 Tax=unclassified Rudaea TaxID=2627037 RepID=UPI0010F802BA|nr:MULTISPECIES: hypothetical protein [unclassified Rudaea]MBN8885980.1 hypothetical protein [Rudaea sp.]MBR0346853.1 hypothetical protein [Rudaea sp.]